MFDRLKIEHDVAHLCAEDRETHCRFIANVRKVLAKGGTVPLKKDEEVVGQILHVDDKNIITALLDNGKVVRLSTEPQEAEGD